LFEESGLVPILAEGSEIRKAVEFKGEAAGKLAGVPRITCSFPKTSDELMTVRPVEPTHDFLKSMLDHLLGMDE
jgi:hypothetical protein